MEKDMEKGKNMMIIVIYYLKENIPMERDIMVKALKNMGKL